MFFGIVNGFADIDDIVSKFLIEGIERAVGVADGIAVDAFFERLEMLGAQTVAAGVDFALGIVSTLEVDIVVVEQVAIHHDESFIHHSVDHSEVGVEVFAEVDSVGAFVFSDECYL